MSELDTLRLEIDSIDSALLELIERRAQLAVRIGAAKLKLAQDNNTDIVMFRPDREAMMLRALLGRKDLTVSETARLAIWRELIAESLRIQGTLIQPVRYFMSHRDSAPEVSQWAHARFGQGCVLHCLHDEKEVIEAAGVANQIGILSLESKGGAWWARLLARPEVSIITALPEQGHGRPEAVVIARMKPEPSGHDMTFWVTDSQASDHEIIGDLSRRGLAAELIAHAQGFKLIGLTGFVQSDDERLNGAKGSLTGVIGAAPLLSV